MLLNIPRTRLRTFLRMVGENGPWSHVQLRVFVVAEFSCLRPTSRYEAVLNKLVRFTTSQKCGQVYSVGLRGPHLEALYGDIIIPLHRDMLGDNQIEAKILLYSKDLTLYHTIPTFNTS